MKGSEDRPVNPIKDILIFEKELRRRCAHEIKRRFMYFVLMIVIQYSYVLYVGRSVYNVLLGVDVSSILISKVMCRTYIRMVGPIFLVSYVSIRLLRKSSKITKTLTLQLKLLNIFYKNQRISLCPIKTPNNIKIAMNIFREEEEKKKAHAGNRRG